MEVAGDGSPRIHVELREEGIHCSRKRVARLMRKAGMDGCHRRRSFRTTERAVEAEPVPDLVQRNFKAEARARAGPRPSRRPGWPA